MKRSRSVTHLRVNACAQLWWIARRLARSFRHRQFKMAVESEAWWKYGWRAPSGGQSRCCWRVCLYGDATPPIVCSSKSLLFTVQSDNKLSWMVCNCTPSQPLTDSLDFSCMHRSFKCAVLFTADRFAYKMNRFIHFR